MANERPWVIRQQDISKMEGGKMDKRYRAVRITDSEVAPYSQAVEDSKAGTKVPRSTTTGGIEGSRNPYGCIVVGQHITAGVDGVERSLGEVLPAFARTLGEAPDGKDPFKENTAAAIAVIQGQNKVASKEPVPIKGLAVEQVAPPQRRRKRSKQSQNADALRDLLAAEAPASEDDYEDVLPLVPRAPIPQEKTLYRVVISGPFGSYKGLYTELIVTSDVVVLLYDEEDAVFTPPVSESPLTISCGPQKYTVYFAGIEFAIPTISQGIQVFLRM